MTPKEAKALAYALKQRRKALGLSASEVARRAGVEPSTLTRLELGERSSPRPDLLKAIAGVLQLPVSDLFAAADWLAKDELPSFRPYLRAKYGQLPEAAVAELERSLAELAQRHGYDADGPAPGVDETAEPQERRSP